MFKPGSGNPPLPPRSVGNQGVATTTTAATAAPALPPRQKKGFFGR